MLVGIGSRLELMWFRWPDKPAGLKLVNLDIDPAQVPRLQPSVAITADAKAGAAQLLAAVERVAPRRASRLDEMQAVKARTWQETQKIQPHIAYLAAIRDVLPHDGFFVEEICQAGFTSYYGFPVYQPRTFVTCGPQGTLGFGFPTALGVKAGNPGKAVVSIAGDGGFMFGIQDLATAVEYGLDLVTIVFNNNAYGNVLRDQKRLFGDRLIGSSLRNPDFVRLAESFGVAAARASTPEQLRRELEVALGRGAPGLIEVPLAADSEASPWEFLMPAPRS